MFDKLFGRKAKKEENTETEISLALAVAALLVEAARADDRYLDTEKAMIDRALAQSFNLSENEAKDLRADAETRQAAALDIQQFTRIAKDMDEERKTVFVEHLWEITLCDGDKDAFEDSLIRRICGLIYFDDRASGEARARVAKRLNQG